MLSKFPATLFSFVCCVLLFHISNAQQDETAKNQTLNQQYKTLMEKSETFNDYKVIKINKLTNFWKVITDSIALVDKSKTEALILVEAKKTQIEELNNTIQQKDKELATGEEEKSTITVFGSRTKKSSYAIISIIIPFALLVVIGFLVVKFRVNTQTTKSAKQDLSTLEKEYEEYKKRALDSQTKLNRELQTERNKLVELNK